MFFSKNIFVLCLFEYELAFSYFEEEPSVLVHDDDIAGPEVDVAFLEHVAKNLLLVVVRIVHVCLKSMTSSLVEVLQSCTCFLLCFQPKLYYKTLGSRYRHL